MEKRLHIERMGVGLVLALPICFLIILSNPPWDTAGAATAYYSILAFLSVTMTASISNRIRIDPSPSNNVLFAGTGYASIVFSGAAILYIITNETAVIHTQTSGVFLNLVAFATTGIIMLLYSTLDRFIKSEGSRWEKRSTSFALMSACLAIFAMLIFVVRLPISDSVFLIAGYFTGAIATLAYLAAAFFLYKNKLLISSSDPYRLLTSFLFFACASVNHTLILPEPSSKWVLSIVLMGLALIIANIAISYPFLLDIGVHDGIAYGVTIATSLFATFPFILSYSLELIIGDIVVTEIGATILIHAGGSVLAGLSAYLLYKKMEPRFSIGQLAIIFLLIYWMFSEIAIILSHFSPEYGVLSETQVSYTCGIILSAMILILAIRQILKPSGSKLTRVPRIYFLGLIVPPILILFGEYVRLVFISWFEFIPGEILGNSLMLGLSYIVLYSLLTYILLLVVTSGGELTLDSIGAALVSVWVMVVILKANFAFGTPGWWVAEGIMYISIIFFAVLNLRMYLAESKQIEKTIPAMTAFSEILSETIVHHQEKSINLMTELTSETQTSEKRLDLLASALSEISHANELAKYIKALVTETSFDEKDLESVDIVNAITIAMNRLYIPESIRKIKEEKKEKHAICALANNLLIEVFYYLFKGISNRIGSMELIGVDVSELEMIPEKQVETTFEIVVKSDNVNERIGLVRRYSEEHSMDVIEFAYSKRIVRLFGGSMSWKTELISNQNLLIIIKIVLNSA